MTRKEIPELKPILTSSPHLMMFKGPIRTSSPISILGAWRIVKIEMWTFFPILCPSIRSRSTRRNDGRKVERRRKAEFILPPIPVPPVDLKGFSPCLFRSLLNFKGKKDLKFEHRMGHFRFRMDLAELRSERGYRVLLSRSPQTPYPQYSLIPTSSFTVTLVPIYISRFCHFFF